MNKTAVPVGLYFSLADVPALRQKISEGEPGLMWEFFKQWLDERIADWEKGERFTKSPRELSGNLISTAFAFSLGPDERYAEVSRKMLLETCRMADWGFQPEGSALRTSEVTQAVSLAYDWLFPALSEDERRETLEAIRKKGGQPLYNFISNPADDRGIDHVMGINWRAVTLSGLGIAGLTLDDEVMINEATIQAAQFIENNYGIDGGYNESLSYCDFATRNLLGFITALRRLKGIDLYRSSRLDRVMDYFLWFYHPRVAAHFSDCGRRAASPECVLRLASEYKDPAAVWYWKAVYGPALEVGGLEDKTPLCIIWYDEKMPEPEEPAPGVRHFRTIDWAAFRTGWDRDSVYFALKSGGGWGHNHHDRNSFILSFSGETLVTDSGHRAYKEKNRKWFLSTSAHNTLTTCGRNQTDVPGRGHKEIARITRFFTGVAFTFLESDATASYQYEDLVAKAAVRRVIYLPPDCFILFDSISLDRAASVEWNLHSLGKIRGSEGSFIARAGKVSLAIRFLEPEALSSEITEGLFGGFSDIENPDKAAWLKVKAAGQPSRQHVFVAALLPYVEGQEPPQVKSEPGKIMITRGGEESIIGYCLSPEVAPRGEVLATQEGFSMNLLRIKDGEVYSLGCMGAKEIVLGEETWFISEDEVNLSAAYSKEAVQGRIRATNLEGTGLALRLPFSLKERTFSMPWVRRQNIVPNENIFQKDGMLHFRLHDPAVYDFQITPQRLILRMVETYENVDALRGRLRTAY